MSRVPPPRERRGRRDVPPKDALDVREAIRQINAIWLSGRVTRLGEYLVNDVVFTAPSFSARVEGLRAAIDSFQSFVRNARVHAFQESEFQIDVFDDSAMATYRFDMTYEFGGASYEEAGREVWLFVRVDRWRLAWRHQLPISRRVLGTPAAG